ncbi:hypothetical protein A2875_05415 [Candidatus Gottesmanbacteria bacterium RIFCSPHIGHO2_01_FULL_46_14]|uniref:UPF0102 protein A2875_05415 n=2 Tax=Candidatus Gottesmaniibacteriota TaxID=1752720 RepID=A0A1F5ZJH3_9BACT|nr:MAG: hypothetical protein A2875_05415 [Candidatus Gottesmanbacteria bacterium RIFCSPHIGHO2_01_FULL_46_14]OGG28588.1 MAG: hypothetical protein A2971_01710 [Candidatus Gottesmanbacteria bacterium RIFCSPLOWO2_01_FULL_46_21]
MKAFNRATGRLAEDYAAETLKKKGLKILERNFGNKFGEIDIIAQDQDTLVFVEVKAKTGIEFGLPEEMISPRKLQKVRNTAMVYTKGKSLPCRIDVVAVVLDQNDELVRLTHYENVY